MFVLILQLKDGCRLLTCHDFYRLEFMTTMLRVSFYFIIFFGPFIISILQNFSCDFKFVALNRWCYKMFMCRLGLRKKYLTTH